MNRQFLVTIKLPKNPNHDPHNKVTGQCLLSEVCTDSTGEHHSILVTEKGLGDLQSKYHITRVEDVL